MLYSIYRMKWNFAKWFVPKYPVHVDFELTSYCNLKCGFCPHSDDSQEFNKEHMDIDMFKNLIDDIQGKVPSIKLNLRGESTLHPQFKEACEYVQGKFTDIRLNTNGNYKRSLNQIIYETFTQVNFSIDAVYARTYDKVHPNGNMDLVEKNIHTLKDKGMNVVLSFVKTKDNIFDLPNFKRYWKKYKLFIREAMNRTDKDCMLGDQAMVGRKNCYMPNRRLVVTANGDIYPCCVQWKKPFLKIGNVHLKSLLDIWNSKQIKNLREALKNKNHDKYNSCKQCDSRESYIWKKL